jgi:hypothetical protein
MRELWDEGTSDAKREAARIAKDAAPYVHPRLANIDQTIHEPAPYVARLPMPAKSAEEWITSIQRAEAVPVVSTNGQATLSNKGSTE